jgi:hypothetical protein
VISASARLTAVLEVLGRYAPDTPPKSRDFRKVSRYLKSCREVFEWFWEVKKRGDFFGFEEASLRFPKTLNIYKITYQIGKAYAL